MKGLKKCNVTVKVANMDRAIEFYTQKLGLELKQRHGDHYAEIDTPNVMLGLHPSTEINTGDNLSVGFGVADLDATLAELRSNGLEITDIQEGWGRIAHLSDPDGNPLYLTELKE